MVDLRSAHAQRQSVEARLVRLETDQGIWLPRIPQPLFSHRRLPAVQLYGANPVAGVPGLRLGPQVYASDPTMSIHHSVSCLLVSDAVFFGCPWGSARKPQMCICALKFGAEAFKSAAFFGVPSDLSRDPPGAWLLSGAPLQFGAGPSVTRLLSRAPFHFGAAGSGAQFLSSSPS